MTTKKLTDYLKQPAPPYHSGDVEQAKSGSERMRFEKETEFQETPIGKIPKEWKLVNLSDVVEIWDKYRVPVKESERIPGPYPYCGANGVIGTINGYTHDGEFVLLAEDGGFYGPFERTAYLMKGKFWANNHVHVLRAKQGFVLNEYLVQYLSFADLRPFVSGTTRPKLPQNSMIRIPIALPPLHEQKQIAEILSTVDFAIEKVRLLVDRAERLKKGLMQELLTKGIGHRECKETPIGKIPKGWEIVKLIDVAEIRGNKSVGKINKVAFIPMELIPDSGVFVKYEIRDLDNVSSFTYCEAGDILVAKITPSFENGKQGIVPDDVPNGFALATTEVYPIACKRVNKLFLFYVLKYPKFRKILESTMRGTTGRRRVSREALENLEIPIPPSYEQQKIAEILLSVDKYIETLRARLAHLEHVKRGLMEVLLTGKVRVIVESS